MADNEERPALYVGTYAKYNNGSIEGKWLYLDDYADADEFLAACGALHQDESDPELMFQDYEHLPNGLYNESLSLKDLELVYTWLGFDERERELIEEYTEATGYAIEDEGDFSGMIDRYFTELESRNEEDQHKELGEYIINEGLLGIEIPEQLQGYIDYEALGRDWAMDMAISSNGFVFSQG